MSLATIITARPDMTYTRTRNGATQTWKNPFSTFLTMATGTGSAQMNRMFDVQETIAASGTKEYDLAGDANFKDGFEQAITFVKVKLIYVKAATGNTNNVEIGGAASNAFLGPFKDATDKIVLSPGGIWLIVHPTTGWTVTAATADKLLIANSGAGTSVTYDIAIAGTDA